MSIDLSEIELRAALLFSQLYRAHNSVPECVKQVRARFPGLGEEFYSWYLPRTIIVAVTDDDLLLPEDH